VSFNDPAALAVLESHGIAPEAFEALTSRDHDRFLKLRQATLMTWEQAFMADHGVRPPVSSQPAPAPLDSDVADDSDRGWDGPEDGALQP